VNRLGRWYIGAVGITGAIALVFSALALPGLVLDWERLSKILLLAVLTWVSGNFAVRVPKVPATIYVSEAFFFTLVLMFGGAPAAVCMAVDGLLISVRRRNHEPFRIVFNIAEPAI
jgi:hypothetical protein